MRKIFYSEPLTGFSKNADKTLADDQNKTGTIHQKYNANLQEVYENNEG